MGCKDNVSQKKKLALMGEHIDYRMTESLIQNVDSECSNHMTGDGTMDGVRAHTFQLKED